MSSSLVPPQVLVDTPRPQKEKGEKQSDLSIALNNYVANRPKSPRSPRAKNNCSLTAATKTITRAKSPVAPGK